MSPERPTRAQVEAWRDANVDDGEDKRLAVMCDAYLALLSEHEQQTAWQPIETAPDDIDVLLWHQYGPDTGDGYATIGKRWRNHEQEEGAPTHWMPLPLPPKE